MPTFRLDFEEWHELYLAAQAVPDEEKRPCLQTAIVGLERLLAECTIEDPDTAKAILEAGAHDCATAECEKALATAMTALASGADPFDARAVDDEKNEFEELVARFDILEATVNAIAKAVGVSTRQR